MKVRDQKAEYAVKKNGKTYKYAEDQAGNLRITDVEAEGLDPSPSLLERLRNADFKNCDKCLTAEMNRSLFRFMFFQFLDLDTEEDLY